MSTVFVDGHVKLTTHTLMLAVLDELVGVDAEKFRGSVGAWPEGNPPGPAKWSLEVNDWYGNQTTAQIGDHLVLTYGRLLKLTDAEYQALQNN